MSNLENLILIRYSKGATTDHRKYEFRGYFPGKFGLEISPLEVAVKSISAMKAQANESTSK